MEKKYLVILFVSAFLTIGMFLFGMIGFLTYDYLDESYTYEFLTSGGDIEDIELSADISDINVEYNKSIIEDPNNSMKIFLNIHVEGMFTKGRSISDFFESVSILNDSSKGIDLRKKPSVWVNPNNWLLGIDVNLTVILRTDLDYNISAIVGTGNIKLESQSNTHLNRIELKTTNGDINLNSQNTNFTESINIESTLGDIKCDFDTDYLNGNVKIITSAGDIALNMYNCFYEKSLHWSVTTNMGDMDLKIRQYKNMGADIEFNALISDIGTINCLYNDTTSSVGAKINGSAGDGGVNLIEPLTGFSTISERLIESQDYEVATYKYNIELRAIIGEINIDAQSQ